MYSQVESGWVVLAISIQRFVFTLELLNSISHRGLASFAPSRININVAAHLNLIRVMSDKVIGFETQVDV